jgi:hypothetical protein
MFTKQTTKALNALFGAAVGGAILTTTPAHAADPAEHTQSTMNQASVYESTLKFYPHPARLEFGIEAPREMTDHPAVIVAKTHRVPSDSAPKLALHPAAISKADQLPPFHTTQVIPATVGE